LLLMLLFPSHDLSTLEFERQAGDWEPWDYGHSSYGRYANDWQWYEEENRLTKAKVSLYNIVRDHPEEVADFLEEYGVDAGELLEACYNRGAVIKSY